MFQLHRLRVGTVHGLGVHRDERPSVRGPDLQLPSGQLPGDGAEPVPRQRLRRVQTGYIYHYAFVMIFGVFALMSLWFIKA